ncbi:MAG: hypothetical protein JWQ85_2579 [Mucilaginibacter sp.]|nr:hypothetical protein [Mucilaginibacter sp.]
MYNPRCSALSNVELSISEIMASPAGRAIRCICFAGCRCYPSCKFKLPIAYGFLRFSFCSKS